jgi:hypothetical protein
MVECLSSKLEAPSSNSSISTLHAFSPHPLQKKKKKGKKKKLWKRRLRNLIQWSCLTLTLVPLLQALACESPQDLASSFLQL